MPKTAVVLLNLGGPLSQNDIKPYLFNFFMDKNIIAAPLPIRYFIAKWIAYSRSKGAADGSYKFLGYKSPLLENTQKQAQALQEKLGGDYRVFVSMRYWQPRMKDVLPEIEAYKPDNIFLLPLYPQFSTATTKSSFEEFRALAQQNDNAKVTSVCCYPLNDGFIKASADNIKKELIKAPPNTRVLFSAHGLPEKTVAAGDPYQWQCEKTAEVIAKQAGLADWQICYQSRVGPLKWIGPSTAEALEKAAADKVGVVVYPHAFVSEHVETLVEIDIEYREMAEHLGVPYFAKAETVGTHQDFIEGLAGLVKAPAPCQRICPAAFKSCICKGTG